MMDLAAAGVQPSEFKQLKPHETAAMKKASDERYLDELRVRAALTGRPLKA